MSLGAGALKVSERPKAISREEVYTNPGSGNQPKNTHWPAPSHWMKFSGDTYLREYCKIPKISPGAYIFQ